MPSPSSTRPPSCAPTTVRVLRRELSGAHKGMCPSGAATVRCFQVATARSRPMRVSHSRESSQGQDRRPPRTLRGRRSSLGSDLWCRQVAGRFWGRVWWMTPTLNSGAVGGRARRRREFLTEPWGSVCRCAGGPANVLRRHEPQWRGGGNRGGVGVCASDHGCSTSYYTGAAPPCATCCCCGSAIRSGSGDGLECGAAMGAAAAGAVGARASAGRSLLLLATGGHSVASPSDGREVVIVARPFG